MVCRLSGSSVIVIATVDERLNRTASRRNVAVVATAALFIIVCTCDVLSAASRCLYLCTVQLYDYASQFGTTMIHSGWDVGRAHFDWCVE